MVCVYAFVFTIPLSYYFRVNFYQSKNRFAIKRYVGNSVTHFVLTVLSMMPVGYPIYIKRERER